LGGGKIIRIHMDVLKIATAGSVDDGKKYFNRKVITIHNL
jgi:hypothetical protein